MDVLYFSFNGKDFSGYLISDANKSYHWLVFNEDELAEILGDSVAFYWKEKDLAPVYQYHRHADFIEQLRVLVKKRLVVTH